MYSNDEIKKIKDKLELWNYKLEKDLFILSEINNILIYWNISLQDESFFIEKYKEIIEFIEDNKLYSDDFEYLEYKAYFYFLKWKTRTLQTLINSYKLIKNNELLLLLIELFVNNNYNKSDVFWYVDIIINNWVNNIYLFRKLKLLLVWEYKYDLSWIDINSIVENIDNSKVEIHPYEIKWIWDKWYCLDEHTVIDSKAPRWYSNSYVWWLMNQIKYHFKSELIWELWKIFWDFLNWKYKKFISWDLPFDDIDLIITTPPSKLDRPFQPVIEIWKEISINIWIPILIDLLEKTRITPQTKTISKKEAEKLLSWIFKINDIEKVSWKNVLIFDDLFWTWTTLNEIVNTLKRETSVNKIFILTITKTRTSYWLRT